MSNTPMDVTPRGLRPGILVEPSNQLLAALLSQRRDIVQPYLRPVLLDTRQVLVEPDEPLTQFYFPQGSAVVSMMRLFQDGRVSEMATVGSDGVVPMSAPLHEKTSFARCIVQIAGPAVALEAARLQDAAQKHPPISGLLAAFTTTLLSQALQLAACNAVHSAEQRCARWLLTAMDRSGSERLALTHELMAEMRRHQRVAGARSLPSPKQLIRVAADLLLLNGALAIAFVLVSLSPVWQGEPAAAILALSGSGEHAWRLIPVTVRPQRSARQSGLHHAPRSLAGPPADLT